MMDNRLNGQELPSNIYWVAAVNPYRRIKDADMNFKDSYYVKPLPPSMKELVWDFGALEQDQERDYINAQLRLLEERTGGIDIALGVLQGVLENERLTSLIISAQSFIRK